VATNQEKLTFLKHTDLSTILHTGDLPSTTNLNNLDSIRHHLDNPIRKEKCQHTRREKESPKTNDYKKMLQNKIQALIF